MLRNLSSSCCGQFRRSEVNGAQRCAPSSSVPWFRLSGLVVIPYLPRDPQSLADQLTRVPPLVVIPAHDLHQITIDALRP